MKKKILILALLFILGLNTSVYSRSLQKNSVSSITSLYLQNIQTYTHPKLDMTILRANFDLPLGYWQIDDDHALTGLKHIQFGVSKVTRPLIGRRFSEIENQAVKRYMMSFYRRIEKYALNHADYTLTFDDFHFQKQAVFKLIRDLTVISGLNVPSFDNIDAAMEWLNEIIIPYQIYARYMNEFQLGLQYEVISDIKEKYSVRQLSQLTESDLKKLSQTVMGKRLKRAILAHRYKLDLLDKTPDPLYGPNSLDDVDEDFKNIFYHQGWDDRFHLTPRMKDPQYFLIPNVKLVTRGYDKKEPLVLELYPQVNDGKHWVLFNNGEVQRVIIDQHLLNQYDIEVEPIVRKTTGDRQTYHLTALVLPKAHGPWLLTLKNTASLETIQLKISLDEAQTATQQLFYEWIKARAQQWVKMFIIAPSTVYQTWLERFISIYDLQDSAEFKEFSLFRQPNVGRVTSLFNLLGGRAAIEETLQMIDLNSVA